MRSNPIEAMATKSTTIRASRTTFVQLATRHGRLALASGRGLNRRIAALFLRDWVRWQILKDIRQRPSRARPAESLLMTSRQTIHCQDSDRVALTCWPVIEDHV
jgi:hypothetical protein